MRIIDADALETHEIYEGEWVRVVYADDIDDTPTVDAVPVVRCKYCIWRLGADCTRFAEVPVSLEDYCSKAERKRSR